jgi:hypothetical protein
VVTLGIMNIIMILCYIMSMTYAMFFLGGLIWSCFSYIYEKTIWTYFFRQHLQDRIASGFLVLSAMVCIYICIYVKVGVSCITFSTSECLVYQMWKTYKARTLQNFMCLLSFVILLGIVIFITMKQI